MARIGYFGSYALGKWGVGSDLDIIVVVDGASDFFEHRSRNWDLSDLPVPADILVYTAAEWQSPALSVRFKAAIERETVWVYRREA
ncbi:MAG: nucleotidyltransferase domain-containing protein [Bryobacteraceae bacterium]|nr:nucleotidyltransferase domain-containing protein [Bryobacteraceae bacterium]